MNGPTVIEKPRDIIDILNELHSLTVEKTKQHDLVHELASELQNRGFV